MADSRPPAQRCEALAGHVVAGSRKEIPQGERLPGTGTPGE